MIYHRNKYLLAAKEKGPLDDRRARSLFTYRLRYLIHVFSIFKELEEGLWSWAVSVGFRGIIFIATDSRTFTETAKVQLVNDSTFIALTAHKFAQSCPNLSNLPQLISLNILVIIFAVAFVLSSWALQDVGI